MLPLCAEEGLGFTPFSPLAGGWLTEEVRAPGAYPAGSRMTLRPDGYSLYSQAPASVATGSSMRLQATGTHVSFGG